MSRSAARGRSTPSTHWTRVRLESQRVTPMFPSTSPVTTQLKNVDRTFAEQRSSNCRTDWTDIHESPDGQKAATGRPLQRSAQLTTRPRGAGGKQRSALQPPSEIYMDLHPSPTRPPALSSHNRCFQTTSSHLISFFGLFYPRTQVREEGNQKNNPLHIGMNAPQPAASPRSPHHSHSPPTIRCWLQSGSAFFEVAILWAGLSKHLTRHLSHLRVR